MLFAASPTTNSNEKAALQWLEAGAKVFPVHGDGSKRPCVVGWQTWHSDPDDPLRHWQIDPSRLVALACGANRLLVIDCDRKNGIDGIAAFRDTCAVLGVSLIGVPCVATPSGGQHFYFAMPSGQRMTNRTGCLPSGIDVRGDGGFVVTAGSHQPDRRCYMPIDLTVEEFARVVSSGAEIKGYRLRALPAGLVNEIHGPFRHTDASLPRSASLPPAATVHVLRPGAQARSLDHDLSAGIRSPWDLDRAYDAVANARAGTRNETLNREAFIAARRVLDGAIQEDEAMARLTAAAHAAGLPDDEISRTLASAFDAGLKPALLDAGELTGDVTQAGKPKPTLKNTKLAITALQITVRRDVFRDQITLAGSGLPQPYRGALTEHVLTWIRNEVLKRYQFDPKDDNVHAAIKGLAEDGRFNPVTDWLDSLQWDQQDRLFTWLPRLTGAADTPLHRHLGFSLLLAMVARARFPGTKFDLCAVLEGPQGSGKSSLVKAIAGEEYFTDAPGLLGMDPKSRGELLAGRWVVELGELSGLSKAETEGVKAAISQTDDHFRAAYERVAVKRPRTFIFIGTTNSQNYLIDTSGNRRFIPVASEKIDLASFAAERPQLFAQADYALARLVERGRAQGLRVIDDQPLPSRLAETLALPKGLWTEAAIAAEERRVVDHGEDVLEEILARKIADPQCRRQPHGAHFISTSELQSELGIKLGYHPHARALAGWMIKLGWKNTRGGRREDQVRGYEKC